MTPNSTLIKKLADDYQKFLKTMSSETNAWRATLNQYSDLKNASSDKKQELLFEVKSYISQEKQESAREKKPVRQTNSKIIAQKHTSVPPWGIEHSLPSEDDSEETCRDNAERLRNLQEKLAHKIELEKRFPAEEGGQGILPYDPNEIKTILIKKEEVAENGKPKKEPGDEQLELFKPSTR